MNVRELQKIFMPVNIRVWLTTNMKRECSNTIAYVFSCQMKCVLYLITSCTVLLTYFWLRLFLTKFRFYDLTLRLQYESFLVLSLSYLLCFLLLHLLYIDSAWGECILGMTLVLVNILFENVLCFTCYVHKRAGQAFLVFTLLLCW